MKKLYILASALLVCITLAACGSNATAATLNQNFHCDSGNVFQLATSQSFKQVAGAVEVVAPSGSTYSYPDATGACFTKLVNASVGFYVNVPGTLEYMNTVSPQYVMCYSSGTQTGFVYFGSNARFIADNCALYNAVKAASN